MPNFVVLGCLEVGEKFVVGWWVGWGHFDTNYQVTPTFIRLGQVRLKLSWGVTIERILYANPIIVKLVTDDGLVVKHIERNSWLFVGVAGNYYMRW